MGYKTEYTLYVHNNIEGDMMDHQVNIEMLMSNEDLFGPSGCTWSDHETFMKRYSMKYPNTIFKLDGAGDTPTDLWRKYFRNGDMAHSIASIRFPMFDARSFKFIHSAKDMPKSF